MKTMGRLRFGISLAGCMLAPAAVQAGPVDALDAMRDYNLIVLEDFRLNHDIQGSVYVGGNLTGGNMVGSNQTTYTGASGLTVGGNVMGTNVKVKNGDVYVGGNVSGTIEVHDGGSAYIGGNAAPGSVRLNGNQQGRRIETGSSNKPQRLEKSDFLALSSELDGRSAETTYSRDNVRDRNNFRINVADLNNDGVAVVDLEAGFFDAVASYGLYGAGLNALDTIVINVAGKNINIDANWQFGNFSSAQFASSHIIWNFFEAETVTLSRQIFGSVLAPGALLSNYTPIDGNVVAGRFNQGGQVHLPGYAGSKLTFAPPPADVPEPATLGLLGFGVLGLTYLSRRKGAAAHKS